MNAIFLILTILQILQILLHLVNPAHILPILLILLGFSRLNTMCKIQKGNLSSTCRA